MHDWDRYHNDVIGHFQCFLVLFFTSDDAIFRKVLYSDETYIAIRQDTVLFYRSSEAWSRIMPHYFVGFVSISSSLDVIDFAKAIWPTILRDSFDLVHPAPSVFLGHYEKRGLSDVTGCSYCWFCSEETQWSVFNCTQNGAAGCPRIMMDAYRKALGNPKNVPWILHEALVKKSVPEKPSQFCPFVLNSSATCTLDEKRRVLRFFIHDSNWTSKDHARMIRNVAEANPFPKLRHIQFRPTYYPVDVILTGGTSATVRFITSDSVRQVGASFSTFLAPFAIKFWLALIAALILLALYMTPLSQVNILTNMVNLSSALVDQFVTPETHVHDPRRPAVSTFMVFWISAVIVISSCYKAVMKSNYVLEPTYTTAWNSFMEMKGFAFIFPHVSQSPEDLAYLTSRFHTAMKKLCNVTGENLYKEACVTQKESSYWFKECVYQVVRQQESTECLFFLELRVLESFLNTTRERRIDTRTEKWLMKQFQVARIFLSKARIRPIEMLEQVLRNELTEPGAAYITMSENFDGD